MPIYVYVCKKCGSDYSVRQGINESHVYECCGQLWEQDYAAKNIYTPKDKQFEFTVRNRNGLYEEVRSKNQYKRYLAKNNLVDTSGDNLDSFQKSSSRIVEEERTRRKQAVKKVMRQAHQEGTLGRLKAAIKTTRRPAEVLDRAIKKGMERR